MVFKKGHIPHNKGKTKDNYLPLKIASDQIKNQKRNEETKSRISLNCRKYQTLETRKKISKSMLGIKKTVEHSRNISRGRKGIKLSEETKDKLSKFFEGDKSSLWRGGKSFEPYTLDFTRRFKKSIRQRDGYCMLCNLGFEELKLLKRYKVCHHINYDKKLSISQNCITLCNVCHSITNFNRDKWITFFQSLLKEKYGYKYTEEQKIILEWVK